MNREEALAEWDKLMSVRPSPKESVTEEARNKAAELFAALYPEFEEADEVCADMLLSHNNTVINCMAMAYQTILNEERDDPIESIEDLLA